MATIGETLIKLFGGSDVDVYLGKVEPSKVTQSTEKPKSNIFKSFVTLIKDGFIDAFEPIMYPFGFF